MAHSVHHSSAAATSSRPAKGAHFAVPGIVFDNRTPFAAAQFDTVDQYDAAFHVFVAKVGYTLEKCDADGFARLVPLDVPVQLNTEDRHVDGDAQASLLEESDFAPYKPQCDVLINAIAYAPGGNPVRQFEVRLGVASPGGTVQQDNLINKTLTVCGARYFQKKAPIWRLFQWPLKIVTLGMFRPNPWRLTPPAPLTQLPLRYELAQGGQCKLDGDHAAHDVCDANPVGLGFARPWFLSALDSARLPAPQITSATSPCSAEQFWRSAGGDPLPEPAGFGAVGRAWQPRRTRVGKIDDEGNWHEDDVPRLPLDFDYAYWNCAPQDQQCDYLNGEETITLVNLCRADLPCARLDRDGNTVLRFVLPRQSMFILSANRASTLTVLPLEIDTVTINPETRRVDLVWRGCLEADGSQVEARLMHITEPEQIERLNMLVELQWAPVQPTQPQGQ